MPKVKQDKQEEKTLGKYEKVSSLVNLVGDSVGAKPISLYRGKYVSNTFSSGSLALDLILGGGLGIGRWVSIFGPEASGKSTILCTIVAMLQRLGVPQLFFDHEGSIDPTYAKEMGVTLHTKKGFFYLPADVGEVTFRFIRRTLKQLPDLDDSQRRTLAKPRMVFFVDSIASMLPQAMDEKDESNLQGQLAQMLSKQIPRVKSLLSSKGCTLIATNQLRLAPMSFGNPEYQPGGQAPKFYPDCTIRVSKHSAPKKTGGEKQESFSFSSEESLYKGGGEDRFIYVKARTIKNKLFSPFLETEMRINLGRGLDPIQDAVSYLEMTGQLIGSGGNYVVSVSGEEPIKVKGWAKLSRLVATPEFRKKCYGQIQSNKAFEMFFEVQRGRVVTETEEKGEDPLAIYSLSEEKGEEEEVKAKKAKKEKKEKKTKPDEKDIKAVSKLVKKLKKRT